MDRNEIRSVLRSVFKEEYVSDAEIDEMASEVDPDRSGFASNSEGLREQAEEREG